MLLMLVNGVLFIITITTIYRSLALTQMFRYSVLLNTSLDTNLQESMIGHNYLVIWSRSAKHRATHCARSNVRTQKARDSRERLRTSSTSSSGQDKANSDLREQMVSLTTRA